MKKTTILIIAMLLIAVFVTACGADGQDSAAAAIQNLDTVNDNTSGTTLTSDVETPLALKLALGTFKLEDTEYPVDSEQAAELLPLWKALRSMSESETAATAEVDALLNQILDTMTPEQITAINNMGLTGQDMATIFEELGLEIGGGAGRFGNMTPEQQATMQAARESGQLPAGGSGRGSGVPGLKPGGGEGEFDPDARATAIAERGGARGAQLGLNPALLGAVIQFLEGKL